LEGKKTKPFLLTARTNSARCPANTAHMVQSASTAPAAPPIGIFLLHSIYICDILHIKRSYAKEGKIRLPVPPDFTTPIRMSAKERAFSQLQRWIIEGVLHPGEKLLDAELAESLAVSRTPIREALQLLEVQGLVSMQPGKETRVTQIEKNDIFKLYPTLAALHALAAELAAAHILPEQLEMLRELNVRFGHAMENGQPYQAMEHDEQFHNLIVDAADNAYIASFSASLQIHIRRFKYVFLKQPMPGSLTASVEEHAAIVRALEQRDAQEAAAMMKQNLIRPMHELYALI